MVIDLMYEPDAVADLCKVMTMEIQKAVKRLRFDRSVHVLRYASCRQSVSGVQQTPDC